jgi:hypothetical protein
MNAEQKTELTNTLITAFEVMGQDMSEAGLMMMATRLHRFDYEGVMKSISSCVEECRYKITLADIIQRIDDGRPSPEKAWQEVQHLTEDDSKVLTTEQNAAFCMVSTSLIDGDTSSKIAARQTFLQEYQRMCKESRDEGKPVEYFLARANRDHDGAKALEAVTLALSENKLPKVAAVKMLPQHKEQILQIPMLEHEKEAAAMIEDMAKGIGSF